MIGVDLQYVSCEMFNFTSLDIESLPTNATCDPRSFVLAASDSMSSALEESLPAFLIEEKKGGNNLNVYLMRGPSEWRYKDTTKFHVTVPRRDTGAWGILHQSFEQATVL